MARSRSFSARLMVCAMAACATLGAAQSPAPAATRVIRVRAERFVFTPSEIRLTQGETVELRIRSDDTAHGFRIVGTNTALVVPKRGRGEVSVRFEATTQGSFEFECDQMCGAGHDFMRGVIRVVPPKVPEAGRP